MTPDQVADLIERLEKAARKLGVMADSQHGCNDVGYARLRGKANGVRLALSYVREYTDA